VNELCDLPGHELGRRFRAGEASALEAVESCLRRIDAVDGQVKAFLERTDDAARRAARA
jgi:Asp-tRNA(Asn)/Glu-tRNA(Gln) amidotransferase A subunit family amidase